MCRTKERRQQNGCVIKESLINIIYIIPLRELFVNSFCRVLLRFVAMTNKYFIILVITSKLPA